MRHAKAVTNSGASDFTSDRARRKKAVGAVEPPAADADSSPLSVRSPPSAPRRSRRVKHSRQQSKSHTPQRKPSVTGEGGVR